MLTGPHYVPRTPASGAPTFSREAQRGRSAGAGRRAGAPGQWWWGPEAAPFVTFGEASGVLLSHVRIPRRPRYFKLILGSSLRPQTPPGCVNLLECLHQEKWEMVYE